MQAACNCEKERGTESGPLRSHGSEKSSGRFTVSVDILLWTRHGYEAQRNETEAKPML